MARQLTTQLMVCHQITRNLDRTRSLGCLSTIMGMGTGTDMAMVMDTSTHILMDMDMLTKIAQAMVIITVMVTITVTVTGTVTAMVTIMVTGTATSASQACLVCAALKSTKIKIYSQPTNYNHWAKSSKPIRV